MEAQLCKALNDCNLLNWTDTRTTGMIVGVVNLVFMTMFLSGLSLFTIVCYTFLIYILVGIVVAQFMEKPNKDDNEYEHVSKETIENLLRSVYSFLAVVDSYMRTVISLSDIKETVKFYVGLYVVMTLSNIFGDAFFLWLLFNTAFLWKPVYNKKREQIDQLYLTLKNYTNTAVKRLDSFIPRYKD